jgi:hypothetical protein
MFITHVLTNPKIKEELLGLGFTGRQIPSRVTLEPVTSDAVDKTKSTETGLKTESI